MNNNKPDHIKPTKLSVANWLIIIAFLLLTVFTYYYIKAVTTERLELEFNIESNKLINMITERLQQYESTLIAGAALNNTIENTININLWRKFSNSLKLKERYPGVNGIGMIYQIQPHEITDFIKQEKKLRPYFNIHPSQDAQEYWPITYIEPEAPNIEAVGLNIAFESNRLNAAKKARDTATTQITKPIILVQDSKQTPGFLLYLPIYSKSNLTTTEQRRQYFIGHIYAPFIMEKLINGTLKKESRNLRISIYDEDTPLIDELTTADSDYDATPLYSKTVTMNVYGRPWHFTINTGMAFKHRKADHKPRLILASGCIITLMLFLFFYISNENKNTKSKNRKIEDKFALNDKYHKLITESAPCGIITTNENGIIERANKKTCDILQLDKPDVIGKSINDFLLEGSLHYNQNDTHQSASSSTETSITNSQNMALMKSGTPVPVEIGVTETTIGADKKIIISIVDMSDYAKIIKNLERSNDELDSFAYIASHDLKAPLRGIMQLSTWIHEDLESGAIDQVKQNLTMLQNRTLRLEKLLDDLLAFSRVGREEGDIASINLQQVIVNIFEILDPPETIQLKLIGNLPTINTLHGPLELVLRNLLDNAIKHHDKSEGIIMVSVDEKNDHYEFSVEDNGPGIAPKFHEQVFELFKTLKPRDVIEGSGMGLSIIKKILKHYGGEISLISDGKSGTCFTFKWPKFEESQ